LVGYAQKYLNKMVQARCPHCKQIITVMANSGDYVHNCNSGDNALDNEDVVRIDVPQWNLQGAQTTMDVNARLVGEDLGVETFTKRGNRVSTHSVRKHFEYIGGI